MIDSLYNFYFYFLNIKFNIFKKLNCADIHFSKITHICDTLITICMTYDTYIYIYIFKIESN